MTGPNAQFTTYGVGFEGIDKFFHKSGLNAAFAIAPLIGAGKTAVSGGFETLDAFWYGQGGYESFARNTGEIGTQIAEAGFMGVLAYDSMKRVGSAKAWGTKGGGTVFKEMKGGGMYKHGGGLSLNRVDASAFRSSSSFSKTFKPGHFKNGKFFKGMSFKRMLAYGFAAPVIGGAVTAMGSLAGRALDTMLDETSNRKKLSYDSRFFSGEKKYDRGGYDQFGSFEAGTNFKMQDAMNQQQAKMMSMARIYHSR
jgi:hypothetical protein